MKKIFFSIEYLVNIKIRQHWDAPTPPLSNMSSKSCTLTQS